MIECLSLQDEGNFTDLDISVIFIDLKRSKDINKVYKNIDLEQREDDNEMQSIHSQLIPISEEAFLKILSESTSMKELFKEIKNSDQDSNGYLTLQELNNIFSQVYPKLASRSMFKIFRPFGSVQNKSLIEYKKMIEYFVNRMTNLKLGQDDNNKHTEIGKIEEKLVPQRLLSPNTKRMENIKNEFLKAAKDPEEIVPVSFENSPERIPDIEIKGKTRLEALLSPRVKTRSLPKLTADNLKKGLAKIPAATALSPRRDLNAKPSQ